jgi:hypothetical protein
MEQLNRIIHVATAAIGKAYIFFPIDGGPAIYRERVYCYEIYHQMRKEWPDDCPYFLNGEVHKGGHPILGPRGFGNVMPDFLVHRPGPGGMAHNHAVIEVKGPDVGDEALGTDLVKLNMFVTQAGYERAIYLIYASGLHPDRHWVDRIGNEVNRLGVVAPIELWLHRTAGTAAANVLTFRPAA